VASWYDGLLEDGKDTYQSELILPNLLRRLGDVSNQHILDLACGQGFFTQAVGERGGDMVGVDISKELITIAKEKGGKRITYFVCEAKDLSMLNTASFDKVFCVLALQNIKEIPEVFAEVSRVLKKGGMYYFILNHPAFRIPQKSAWEFDQKAGIQYRRIEGYLSEHTTSIVMHPGDKKSPSTLTFHRPLQYYVKALEKAGFILTHLEEWNSHRKSQKGPRQKAEDTARKEIPLFLLLEGKRV
jgi:ubiquinone/menaquinone biosynthesis C-methylase UbiE